MATLLSFTSFGSLCHSCKLSMKLGALLTHVTLRTTFSQLELHTRHEIVITEALAHLVVPHVVAANMLTDKGSTVLIFSLWHKCSKNSSTVLGVHLSAKSASARPEATYTAVCHVPSAKSHTCYRSRRPRKSGRSLYFRNARPTSSRTLQYVVRSCRYCRRCLPASVHVGLRARTSYSCCIALAAGLLTPCNFTDVAYDGCVSFCM